MKRLTRHIDEYPCRIIDCSVEDWIEDLTGVIVYNKGVCDQCPFEKYINRLAELEDETERMEDDGK